MKNKLVYVLIFLLGALVAATGTKIYFDKKPKEELTTLKDQKKPKKRSFFDSFFGGDDNFFGEEMFDQMDQMAEKMFDQMDQGPKAEGNGQLRRYEDESYVYLEFKLGQIDKNSLNLTIKDGNITLKGQTKIEKTTQSQFGSSTSISISSFHKNFPVPEGVREEEVEVDQKDGAIILKFPKKAKI